jgi:hypothetical protein
MKKLTLWFVSAALTFTLGIALYSVFAIPKRTCHLHGVVMDAKPGPKAFATILFPPGYREAYEESFPNICVSVDGERNRCCCTPERTILVCPKCHAALIEWDRNRPPSDLSEWER